LGQPAAAAVTVTPVPPEVVPDGDDEAITDVQGLEVSE
jgi:hypothetical protein